jgi:CDP-diacylglycerol--serine O-phosphatidyltransferase
MGKLGWLAAFVYAASTALRLARFNTQAASVDKRFFQGLPCPAAAALLSGMIWLGETQEFVEVTNLTIIAFPITVLAGILMVSNIRFYSFKEVDLRGRVPFVGILLLVLLFVFIASEPPLVLFSISLVYAISGPAMTLLLIRKHRAARKLQESPDKEI